MTVISHTHEASRPAWLERVTLAHALLALIVVAGATLRFSNLDSVPLSPAEASQTLQVWRFWQPDAPPLAPTFSPVYVNLTAPLTQLLGFSDAVMRLIPALFGAALVALPWLLRQSLGNVGALFAAFLLALSPSAVALSRTAGGEAIALSAALLLVVAVVRLLLGGSYRWTYVAAGSLALGAASGPLFYSALLALGFGVAAQATRPVSRVDGFFNLPERQIIRRAALVAAAVFFVAGLLFFWNPLGLGAAASLFTQWLGDFGLARPLSLLALIRYELPLVILAAPAAGWIVRLGRLAPFFLAALLGGLILLLVQPAAMANVAFGAAIAALVAGRWAGALLAAPLNRASWLAAGLLFVAVLVVLFQLTRYSRAAALEGSFYYLLIAALAAAIAILGAQVIYNVDRRAAAPGLLLGFLPLLVIANWGTAWWLGHAGFNDTREVWVQSASDDELPLLLETVREVGEQLKKVPESLQIVSTVNDPVLEWYFREYHFEMAATLPPGATDEVILMPEASTPALGAEYLSAAFGLRRTGVEPGQAASLPSRIHWLLTHVSPQSIAEERVILRVRADLGDIE